MASSLLPSWLQAAFSSAPSPAAASVAASASGRGRGRGGRGASASSASVSAVAATPIAHSRPAKRQKTTAVIDYEDEEEGDEEDEEEEDVEDEEVELDDDEDDDAADASGSKDAAVFSAPSPHSTDDICCPICRDTFNDAFVTKCGHSYCFTCITTHLRGKNDCPVCASTLRSNEIFPNMLLNKLIEGYFKTADSAITVSNIGTSSSTAFHAAIRATTPKAATLKPQHLLLDNQPWSVDEIDSVVTTLMAKRKNLESEKRTAELLLIKDFLSRMRREKEDEVARLRAMVSVLSTDMDSIERELETLCPTPSNANPTAVKSTAGSVFGDVIPTILNTLRLTPRADRRKRAYSEIDDSESASGSPSVSMTHSPAGAGAAEAAASSSSSSMERISLLRRQEDVMSTHLNDLKHTYFNMRMPKTRREQAELLSQFLPPGSNINTNIAGARPSQSQSQSTTSSFASDSAVVDSSADLAAFSTMLTRMSQYSSFRTLSHIYHADRILSNGTVTSSAGGGGGGQNPNSSSSSSSSNSSIISSIDFDRDDDVFATAGVARRIRIYRYTDVVGTHLSASSRLGGFITAREDRRRRLAMESPSSSSSLPAPATTDADTVDGMMRFPVAEMLWKAKISCVSWSPEVKSVLASSDYEGGVVLWDTLTQVPTLKFEEHQKRAWTVDFNRCDPNLIASGGDDSKVKVWARNQPSSVNGIDTKANICSVKWNPTSPYELAFGSADHKVYIYDLRNTNNPLFTLSGHSRAVSYVQFISGREIISASTDSTLKLWDLKSSNFISDPEDSPGGGSGTGGGGNGGGSVAVPGSGTVVSPYWRRTFASHRNEKNFVGLGVNSTGDFIACGSETNSVYAYHRGLSQALIMQPFGRPIEPIHGFVAPLDDPTHFVTSVCWKRKSPDVLAVANSQGRVKILQLC